MSLMCYLHAFKQRVRVCGSLIKHVSLPIIIIILQKLQLGWSHIVLKDDGDNQMDKGLAVTHLLMLPSCTVYPHIKRDQRDE